MNLCKYCNQIATYPPKTKWSGWCCSERFYDCPGYRNNLKKKSNPWNKGLKGVQIPWNKGSTDGTFKGKTHTKETKKKIAEAMYGNKNANHRGDRQSYYKGIRMDSSWEVMTAEYFDNNKINWRYDEKGYKLSDGRVYYPDFFIYNDNNDFIKLVEVKGYFRKENKEKFEKFLNEYPEIKTELWNKKVLKDKKIL